MKDMLTEKIHFRVPKEELAQLDRVAELNNRSRANQMLVILRAFLRKQAEGEEPEVTAAAPACRSRIWPPVSG